MSKEEILSGALFKWDDIKPILSLGIIANIIYFGGNHLASQAVIGEFAHLTMMTTGIMGSACAVIAFLVRVIRDE